MPTIKPIAAGLFGQQSSSASLHGLAAHATRAEGRDMAGGFSALMAMPVRPMPMAA